MAALSPKQARAAAALLTGSPGAAAAAAGVSARTLSRWRSAPAFRATFQHASRRALDESVARLRGATGAALDALIAALASQESEGVRVRAASLLLDFAIKVDGDELRERVERLEEALKYEPRK